MHERVKPDGVWEPVPGLYSQVVAADGSARRYEIAGTLPYDSHGGLVAGHGEQAREVMRNIDRSLRSVDLTPEHVVRINIFTTDMDAFLAESLETVFGYFGDTRPSSTLVEVSRLANPEVLVEIEAVAIAGGRD